MIVALLLVIVNLPLFLFMWWFSKTVMICTFPEIIHSRRQRQWKKEILEKEWKGVPDRSISVWKGSK